MEQLKKSTNCYFFQKYYRTNTKPIFLNLGYCCDIDNGRHLLKAKNIIPCTFYSTK